MVAVVMYPANRMEFLEGLVPLIVGGIGRVEKRRKEKLEKYLEKLSKKKA